MMILPSTLFLEAPPLPYIHLLIHSSISVWIFIWCSSYAPFPAWCFSPNMFVFLNMVFILSSHKRECTRTCDVAWNQFAYSCVPCIHRALGDVREGLNGWHTPVFHPYLDTRTRVQLPAWGIAWTHHGLNGWHPFHSIWPRRPMMTLQHAVHQVAAAMLGGVAIATARHSRPRRKSMMMCIGKGGSFAAASFVRSPIGMADCMHGPLAGGVAPRTTTEEDGTGRDPRPRSSSSRWMMVMMRRDPPPPPPHG